MRSRGSSAEIATLVANVATPRIKPATGQQYAALPWRVADGELQILLVTSRQSQRWIIPKGWPIRGLSAPASAAQEAFEEAGLVGRVSFERLGSYHYIKRMKNGANVPCNVDVFPLEVQRQRREWPEKHQRTLRWCGIAEAVAAVSEPELKTLIRRFARLHHQPVAQPAEK